MQTNRPFISMFMLTSVDGKISTGSSDKTDFDTDIPKLAYASKGLHQYYDLEQNTENWTILSGRTAAKLQYNDKQYTGDKKECSVLVIDNTSMEIAGIQYLLSKFRKVVLATQNNELANKIKEAELLPERDVILGEDCIKQSLQYLSTYYGVYRMTLQGGGTLNSLFFRQRLVDQIELVVAPLVIGGKNTPTLVDGEDNTDFSQVFSNETSVVLQEVKQLEHSYLYLKYKVINI